MISSDILRDLPFSLDFFGKAHNFESHGGLLRKLPMKNMKQNIRASIHPPERKPTSYDFMSSHQFVFDQNIARHHIVGIIATTRSKVKRKEIFTVLRDFPRIFAIIHRPFVEPRILQQALRSVEKGEVMEI